VGSLTGVFGEKHPAWKGGYGRDFENPSTEDYVWKNGVRALYGRKCALTGATEDLCCPHLNGWSSFPAQGVATQHLWLLRNPKE
jgi:hypothetical protein